MFGYFHKSLLPASVAVLLALSLALVSCKKDPAEGGSDGAQLLKAESLSLGRKAGEIFISVYAVRDWTLELRYDGDAADGWASFKQYSGTGVAKLVMAYTENTADDPRMVTILLATGGKTYELDIVQAGKLSKSGLPEWMELPVVEDMDGCIFAAHDMDGKKYQYQGVSGVRNWSCLWVSKEHLSPWVAYPLNKKLIGSGSRINDWNVFDPCVPEAEQPSLGGGSYGGGWERGHQIPSADRLSEKANISTFYPTNMTPQQGDFNAGIWARLEGKVRNYAGKSDTLYVVTGCVIDGSTSVSGSSSGFAVRIPTHYYKALLRYSRSSGEGWNGYMAAGFILPHRKDIAGGNCLDYIMSIDELEDQVGIDFFPLLEAKVGAATAAKIESQTPGSWWK